MQNNIRTYFDLAIGESQGNGGDLLFQKTDMALVRGYENQVYLALFGGNVEEDTPSQFVPGEQRKDWWANALLFRNNRALQLNSKTERTLNNTALNSAGRVTIENAIKEDLNFMSDLGATVEVSVQIISQNVIKININTIWSNRKSITVFEFSRSKSNGDFNLTDFNFTDFVII